MKDRAKNYYLMADQYLETTKLLLTTIVDNDNTNCGIGNNEQEALKNMENLKIPKNYKSALDLHDTQVGIKTVKDFFQGMLSTRLNLQRVTAPLFVIPESGLNDNLNGVERPVSFDILNEGGREAEIVHSLAKWKRYALKKYGFNVGEGLYTDMNAIRRDEVPDNIHSIFVDQWDWEKVIDKKDRNIDFLKETKVAQEYVDAMKTKTPSVEQAVGNLSGGNQQKVLLSKWMFAEPDVLILDEPTRGIDVGAKYEIYSIMNQMVAEGKAVVMISSELPELLGMCDRIYVMNEGEIVGEFKAEEATQEKIMSAILSHNN